MTIRIYIETMGSDKPAHPGLSIKKTLCAKMLVEGETDTDRALVYIVRRVRAINVKGIKPKVNVSFDITPATDDRRITVAYDTYQVSEARIVSIIEKAVADACPHQYRLRRA